MAAAAEAAAQTRENGLVGDEREVRTLLDYCGFTSAVQRERISNESFMDYTDLQQAKEKDITELSESFQKRTPATQRIIFGQRRVLKLKSTLHWARDFRRINAHPSLDGLNRAGFLTALDTAKRRQEIRLEEMANSDQVMREASPGPLVSEAKWTEWEPAFENFLSSGFGADGVPLSYVIREQEFPDPDATYNDFTEQAIACAPLFGPAFDADKRRVHQYIVSFTKGQLSEDWIKGGKKKKNGRDDMIKLRDHFKGEGNSSRRIAVAERLRDSLHYKNERSLSFEMFLSQCQKMFNIFETQNEEYTEEAKVRFLLKKVIHPGLSQSVETMKEKQASDPTATTFTYASNYLAARVSELPDYIAKNRTISGITAQDDKETAPTSGVLRSDGSVFVGHYPNWASLSQEDKNKVIAARGNTPKKGGGGKSKTRRREFRKLRRVINKSKRQIAALQKQVGTGTDDQENENEVETDAGDQFGGKRSKKKKE